MSCTNCGAPVAAGATNCDRCGARVARPAVAFGLAAPVDAPFVGTRPAGFWIRGAALLIDTALLWIATLAAAIAVAVVVGLVMSRLGQPREAVREAGRLVGYAIGFGANLLWFPVMEASRWQATVGKRIVHLKVIDAGGARLSLARALVRYLAKFVSGLLFGIGYMMAGWSERKQALHDRIAKTYVVRA